MTVDTREGLAAEVERLGRGRVPADLRRRYILAVAMDLFATDGFASTSMADLARGAGVTKPVVYELVGSKDEVFAACMQAVADDLARAISAAVVAVPEGPHAAVDRLRAGTRAWFSFVDSRRPAWAALLGSGDAPATTAVEAIRARQDAFVASQLADAGALDPIRAGAVATAMNGAFEAMGRWWIDHPVLSLDEIAGLFTELVEPGLAALLGLAVDG